MRRDDGNYLREGEWTHYFPNGLVREQGMYVNDTKSGVWSVYEIETGSSKYHESNEHYISHKVRYENGVAVYRWVYSYKPWIVSAEGPRRRDKNDGKWTLYNAVGKRKAESIYDVGRIVGWTMFDESGAVFAMFADGVYTLNGEAQQQSTIPKTRNFETSQLSGYCSDAWQHAHKLWPQAKD